MSFVSYVKSNLTFVLAIVIAITFLVAVLVARYEPDASGVWVTSTVIGMFLCGVLMFAKLPNRNELLETLKKK